MIMNSANKYDEQLILIKTELYKHNVYTIQTTAVCLRSKSSNNLMAFYLQNLNVHDKCCTKTTICH